MLHKLIVLSMCAFGCGITLCTAATTASANVTDFVMHRQKRFLIFENGGVIKLVVGNTLPVNFADPITFRSVVISYNLQGGQYPLPTTPTYAWDKWEENFMRRRAMQHEFVGDETRLFVYTALERFMDRRGSGGGGHVCLLRAICENAQVTEHIGIVAEVLNIVLTPGHERNLNAAYAAAQRAGDSGADCLQLYDDCPSGANFLDQYLDYW